METRKCCVCGVEYPLTREFFTYRNKAKGIYHRECIECGKKRKNDWYAKLKEERPEMYQNIRSKNAAYYNSHKEDWRANSARWKREHKRETQDSFNRRRTERMKDPTFAFVTKARRTVRYVVMNKGERDNRASKFVLPLTGLTTLELHNYLLDTFRRTYGYEWDGVEPTHVDHIIPLCTESTLEGKQKLFHYTNLRLVKEADNRAKGTSLDYQIGGCQ